MNLVPIFSLFTGLQLEEKKKGHYNLRTHTIHHKQNKMICARPEKTKNKTLLFVNTNQD
jgi:hypothetical protein